MRLNLNLTKYGVRSGVAAVLSPRGIAGTLLEWPARCRPNTPTPPASRLFLTAKQKQKSPGCIVRSGGKEGRKEERTEGRKDGKRGDAWFISAQLSLPSLRVRVLVTGDIEENRHRCVMCVWQSRLSSRKHF